MSGSQDRTDNSQTAQPGGNNQKVVLLESSKLVPWLMLTCILSALALGLVIANMVQQPQITDAKIDARMAEVKAIANVSREHARIALDKVEQTQVQLGAKGIVFPSTH